MNTLHLVAPDHREAAELIPIFDYDAQPVGEIRGALLAAYGQKYGSLDSVEKEELHIARENGEPPVRALLYRPKTGTVRGAILHMHGGGWIAGTPDMMAAFCGDVADRHGVVVLSVDYRLAPVTGADSRAIKPRLRPVLALRGGGATRHQPRPHRRDGGQRGRKPRSGHRPARAGRPYACQGATADLSRPRRPHRGPNAPVDNPFAGEFVLSRKYLRQLWKARLAHAAPTDLSYLAPARAEDLAGVAPQGCSTL